MALTSSTRYPKSAASKEGASDRPAIAESVRVGLFRLDDGDEHPVGARQMRCQQPPITPGPTGQSFGWSRPETVHDLHGLGRHDGADRVDEAARRAPRGRWRRPASSSGGPPVPRPGRVRPDVGSPVGDAGFRTRNTEHRAVPGRTSRTRAVGTRRHRPAKRASGARLLAPQPAWGWRRGQPLPGLPMASIRCMVLPPGAAARSATRLPGPGLDRVADRDRRGILERVDPELSGLDHVGVRHSRHRVPRRQGSSRPVPHRHRGVRHRGNCKGSRLVLAPSLIQFRDEPAGKSQFQGAGLEADSEIGLSPGQPSEQRVGETGGPSADGANHLDPGVGRHRGRGPPEPEFEGGDPEGVEDPGFDFRERA